MELRTSVVHLAGPWDASRSLVALCQVLTNAVQYSRSGNGVVICVDRQADNAVVSVIDRGIGIPGDELASICEPFFRARNVPDHPSRLGLGLSTARLIVEQYGGTLDITSLEGSGTQVTVRLPLETT